MKILCLRKAVQKVRSMRIQKTGRKMQNKEALLTIKFIQEAEVITTLVCFILAVYQLNEQQKKTVYSIFQW